MRRIWKTLLVIGCLLSFVLLLGFFNASKPRILVLHSAGPQSYWAGEFDRGMRAAMKDNRRPISVEWMYLDAAAPAAGRRTEQNRAEVRRAVARIDPDVLVAVDDETNLLIGRDYLGRKDQRILYVSLDRPPAEYGYQGAPNVSGIGEQMPFAAVRDAVTDLFPGPAPRVSVIGVDNLTGRAELDQARAFDWGPVKVDAAQLVSTAAGWRDFVTGTGASDVLVVLGCQDLPEADGTVFSAADAARWTQEHAEALPIGTQVDFVQNGGGLSFSPPPDYYGRQALQLALDWLDDRSSPGPPAPVLSGHFEVGIRQEALRRRGIELPPIYLEAARENDTLYD